MKERFILKSVTDTLTGKKIHEITVPIKEVEPPKKVIVKAAEPIIVKRTFLDRLLLKPIPQVRYTEEVVRYEEPESYRTFEIWPCIVKNMYRVAGNASVLIDHLHDDHSENLKLVNDNLPIISYIVAAAIQNNKHEPDPELIEFIEVNMDMEDLYTTLLAAFDNAGMQAFSNSIVLMKGTTTILKAKTSPKDGRESIASHIPILGPFASTLDGRQIQ